MQSNQSKAMLDKAPIKAYDSVRCNKLMLNTKVQECAIESYCCSLLIIGMKIYVLVMIVDGVNVEPKSIY